VATSIGRSTYTLLEMVLDLASKYDRTLYD
jgi:hypothetical protein